MAACTPHRAGRFLVHWTLTVCFFFLTESRATHAREFRLARFSADVTIPLGHRCMGILPTKAKRIDDPLLVHGWILQGGELPVVFAAFDWCEIRNESFDRWREILASAVGTSPQNVIISSLHQHDAPVIDSGAQKLLDEVGLDEELFDPVFLRDCERRVCQAAKESLQTARPVTHLGIGRARVENVASNRRVVHLDGRVDYDRYSSSGADPFHAGAEDGLIDSALTTISFWEGARPLMAMSHYAVHPMSYYGRGGVSYDFVGIARERRYRTTGIPQMYVSGCSGDLTAGKYNNGTVEMRLRLAARMESAMKSAWEHTELSPLSAYEVRHVELRLPFHEGPEFGAESLESVLEDESESVETRVLAAMGLASRRRWDAGATIDMPCIDFGVASIVLLPGEAFVGYQVLAQQMRREQVVIAVGYGDCWTGYVPTEKAFAENFSHDWRWVGRGAEAELRVGLAKVLEADTASETWMTEWGDRVGER